MASPHGDAERDPSRDLRPQGHSQSGTSLAARHVASIADLATSASGRRGLHHRCDGSYLRDESPSPFARQAVWLRPATGRMHGGIEEGDGVAPIDGAVRSVSGRRGEIVAGA
jgi:hypothetical protein